MSKSQLDYLPYSILRLVIQCFNCSDIHVFRQLKSDYVWLECIQIGHLFSVTFEQRLNPFSWSYGNFFIEVVQQKYNQTCRFFVLKQRKSQTVEVLTEKQDKYDTYRELITIAPGFHDDMETHLSGTELQCLLKNNIYKCFHPNNVYSLSYV